MASVSITHLILFIASLLVAASVAGVLTQEVGRLSEAINDQGLDASQQVRTDIEIISDSGAEGIYDSSNITIYVKNTGTERLDGRPQELDVLVDGKYQSNLTVTVLDGSAWNPNDVAEVQIYHPGLADGDHRLKVIVNGDEEVFRFRT